MWNGERNFKFLYMEDSDGDAPSLRTRSSNAESATPRRATRKD